MKRKEALFKTLHISVDDLGFLSVSLFDTEKRGMF